MKKVIALMIVVLFLVSCQTTPSDKEVDEVLSQLSDEELQELSELDLEEDALVGEARGKKSNTYRSLSRELMRNKNYHRKLSKELTKRYQYIINKEIEVEKNTEEPKEEEQNQGDKVNIQNNQFSPASIEITVGDTVKWVNNDDTTHQIVGGYFGSGDLNQGDEYSHTFNNVGVLPYACGIHPSMQGIISVNAVEAEEEQNQDDKLSPLKDKGSAGDPEEEKKYKCTDFDKSKEPFDLFASHIQHKKMVIEEITPGFTINSEEDVCSGDLLTEYYCTEENKMSSKEINCIPENVDENGCYDYDYYGGCDEGKCILEIGSSKCTETIQDFLEKALYKMNHCILAHETSESVKIIDDVEYVIKFLDVQAPPPRVSFTLEYEGGSEYFTNKVGTEEETLEDGTKVIISEISLGENSATICIE